MLECQRFGVFELPLLGDGEPRWRPYSCDVRMCSRCNVHRTRHTRDKLRACLQGEQLDGREVYFLTLTLRRGWRWRHNGAPGSGPANALGCLDEALRRFIGSRREHDAYPARRARARARLARIGRAEKADRDAHRARDGTYWTDARLDRSRRALERRSADRAQEKAHVKARLETAYRASGWWDRVSGAMVSIELLYHPRKGWHPHAHILFVGRYWPHENLKRRWRWASRGRGSIVHIERAAGGEQSITEVVKYLSKPLQLRASAQATRAVYRATARYQRFRWYGDWRQVRAARAVASLVAEHPDPDRLLAQCELAGLDRVPVTARGTLADLRTYRELGGQCARWSRAGPDSPAARVLALAYLPALRVEALVWIPIARWRRAISRARNALAPNAHAHTRARARAGP